MPNDKSTQLYYPFYPPVPPATKNASQTQPDGLAGSKPPRRPDWLLILIGVFVLIVLVIIWFVDIPALFR